MARCLTVVKTPDHLVHFSGYGDLTHNFNRKILDDFGSSEP